MIHINIQSSSNNIEIVSINLIQKLYEYVSKSSNTSLIGNLQCDHCRQTAYEYLMGYIEGIIRRYPNLSINAIAGVYLDFYDQYIESVFATKWGDGYGVTSLQLANVRINSYDVSQIFSNSPDFTITDLRDFKRIGYQPSDGSFGSNYPGNKTKNVIHAYIPSAFNSIATGGYNSAFGSALKDIEIENTVTSFGHSAFYGCSNLEMSTIPNCITRLYNSCFMGCSKITINSTNNVTNMGSNMFQDCVSITSFTIKNICRVEGAAMFLGCSNLEEVIFEQGSGPDIIFSAEGSWGSGWFVGTKITKLDLPERVVSFGNASLNCSTLRTLIIRKTTVPTKGSWSLNSNVQIYVPDESIELYKNEWTDVANRIHGISTLPS